jgi:ribonuclease HI
MSYKVKSEKVKYYAAKFKDGSSWLGMSWPDCQKRVHGVPGVLFKSFATRELATEWIEGLKSPPKQGLRVYVDGSFMPKSRYAGWGWVAVENGKVLASAYGKTPLPAESRNIDGELCAATEAMHWLASQGRYGVICHDYEGVARWALAQWKANSAVAKRYLEDIAEVKKWADFEKVDAHTGEQWNEMADQLAKKALEG